MEGRCKVFRNPHIQKGNIEESHRRNSKKGQRTNQPDQRDNMMENQITLEDRETDLPVSLRPITTCGSNT